MHNTSSLILRDENADVWVSEDNKDKLEVTLENQERMFYEFKQLWYDTYLLSLREQSRDLYQVAWDNKIKVGDVVLIRSPIKSRPFWLLGRVLEVILGHDNKIRSVRLKQGNGIVAHHSINNLFPLELSLTHDRQAPPSLDTNSHNQDEPNSISDQPATNPNVRPKRAAAFKLDKFIKANLADL